MSSEKPVRISAQAGHRGTDTRRELRRSLPRHPPVPTVSARRGTGLTPLQPESPCHLLWKPRRPRARPSPVVDSQVSLLDLVDGGVEEDGHQPHHGSHQHPGLSHIHPGFSWAREARTLSARSDGPEPSLLRSPGAPSQAERVGTAPFSLHPSRVAPSSAPRRPTGRARKERLLIPPPRRRGVCGRHRGRGSRPLGRASPISDASPPPARAAASRAAPTAARSRASCPDTAHAPRRTARSAPPSPQTGKRVEQKFSNRRRLPSVRRR